MKRVNLVGAIMVAGCLAGCSPNSEHKNSANHSLPSQAESIRINQHGYIQNGVKRATVVSASKTPMKWTLSAGEQVLTSGNSNVFGIDKASGQRLHQVDFSDFNQSGTFNLTIGQQHRTVHIKAELYQDLLLDSARFFYFHRMGEPVLAEYLHDPRHAHAAIHPNDNKLACYQDWCGEGVQLNVKNTWYDAGDFGAYPVNAAISIWTLLNAYEFSAIHFADEQLNIPESGNGIPDLLDEVRFGATFMAGTLPPNGQLASHKIHNQNWSGFEGDISIENAMERYAQPPSTAATYAVARTSAQLARVFKEFDQAYALQQWQIAKDAWQRAELNPVVYYTNETPDSTGGGDYDDIHVQDDRYAALAELWISAEIYNDPQADYWASQARYSPEFLTFDGDGAQQWQSTEGTGTLSLWLHRDVIELTAEEKSQLQAAILTTAQTAQTRLSQSGYPMIYNPSMAEPEKIWPWGSNSSFLNRMIVLAYAHQLTGQDIHLQAMYQGMDYLLGNNPLNLSYITGYGDNPEQDLHDRIAYPLLRDKKVPFPPGWVAGGPLTGWEGCDNASPEHGAPATRYAGSGTATEAWCSKEVTINWNSPLLWVTAYLSAQKPQ